MAVFHDMEMGWSGSGWMDPMPSSSPPPAPPPPPSPPPPAMTPVAPRPVPAPETPPAPRKKAAAKKTAGKKAPAKKAAAKTAAPGFTEAERAAMKDRAAETKAARRGATKADDLATLLEKIAEMQEPDRMLAERIHEIITSVAPELAPRTWYGMPAYAKDGKIICFFQSAAKFKARYATLGFNDPANLDEGTMWPTSWALKELTPADEKKITALVKKAVR